MGYPIDKIGIHTRLYSLIGINAIEQKHDIAFNNFFQQIDTDCKMMPLNIREDDIGFFLNSLKNSKINAVFFEKEYWQRVYSLLMPEDEELQFCSICDTIDIINNQYRISLTQGRAILHYLQEQSCIDNKTVLIAGSTPSAKSFLFHLVKNNPEKIILADENIENLIEMMNFIPRSIVYEIERIQENKIPNIGNSNIFVNFTKLPIQITNVNRLDFNQDFDKIITQIAKIKTKEWSENG